MKEIPKGCRFTCDVFLEGDLYVSHCIELDVSTSAKTFEELKLRTMELVQIHLREAERDGTLKDLLSRCQTEPVEPAPATEEWRAIPFLLNLVIAERFKFLPAHG